MSAKCFFAHRPFTHKAGKPARAGIFSPDYPVRFTNLYAKSSYARTHFTGLQVSPLLPEAFLLTGSDKTIP